MAQLGHSTSSPPVVGLAAIGDMGSWIARRLTRHRVRVVSAGAGRSTASLARAISAGVEIVSERRQVLEVCDLFISVVPPAVALTVAQEVAAESRSVKRKPLFIDLNAISSPTVLEIKDVLHQVDCPMIDGCILGTAPKDADEGPRLFVSGARAAEIENLNQYGLPISVIGPRVGSASALKCCYAAIGKGITAVAIEAVLAASQSGADRQLYTELAAHMPDLMNVFKKIVPDAFGRAGRWVGEMQEIACEFDDVPGGRGSFEAAAQLYAAIAQEGVEDVQAIRAVVSQFFRSHR
jgi:3-hydroxyisobutyrate dehydrogenase-like beta-hydroxyacid dehydrogenase